MTKEELVAIIARDADVPKATAEKALKALVSGISDSLSRGDSVTLVGFGTFTVVNRAARRARNPRTGEEIQVPATRSPKFKPGKALKDAVR